MLSLTPHQKEALEYRQHISLTANAGSGKTFVLSNRYLQIVKNEEISLREIAAITFTDKAAGELYKRIATEVNEILKTNLKPEDFDKWNRVRRELVSAHISTIHSFCVDILKQFPVEANIDANFTPIDNIVSNEIIELAIEDTIKKIFLDDEKNEEIKKIIRILGSKNSLHEVISSLINQRRKVEVIKGSIFNKRKENITKYFSEIYDDYLHKLFEEETLTVSKNIKFINDAILQNKHDNKYALEIYSLISKIDENKILKENLKYLKSIKNHLLTGSNTVRKQGYLQQINSANLEYEINLIEEFYSKISNLELDINEEEINQKLTEFSWDLLNIYQLCLDNYEKRKSELSYLDYDDILLYTKKIISNQSVTSELSQKFKYIMIDEYQDTNELQYNIFLPILDYLKKGNLFIVGDEKQSIYSFRDADLNIFNKTKNDIKISGGDNSLLSLPDSFRMSPVISAFTNYFFEKIFSNPNPLYNEVDYSEIVCARDDNIKGKIEMLLTDENEEGEGDVEAELVAKRIINLVKEDKWEISEEREKKFIQWQDIAILCRKRKSFKILEKVFVKYSIPYTIVGGQGFYQRQPIYDVYNYFSFLLDSNNDTALIGVLRSPFFNLSDAILFEISLEDGESFWAKFKTYSLSNKRYETFVNNLNKNIDLSQSSDIPFILRKILDESPFLSTLSSRINGDQEIANIKKLLSITNNYSQNPFITLYDYVEFLKAAIEKVSDEAQSNLILDSSAVKIMTLHQAKGLEFPAVFLYNCSEQNNPKTKKIIVDDKFGILTKLPPDQGYFEDFIEPPLLTISKIINGKKEEAELKRLLYVGITRAKDYLFISSVNKKNFKKNSFMGLMSSVFSIDESQDEIKINTNLTFLETEEGKYSNIIKEMEINIPILKSVALKTELQDINEVKGDKTENNLNLKEISDQTSGEIISATKIAVYSQCPLKYKFTYDLGLTKLYEDFKNYKKNKNEEYIFEFNLTEAVIEEEFSEKEILSASSYPPEIKGRIIHDILQKEITFEKLDDYLNNYTFKNNYLVKLDEKSIKDLIGDIEYDLKQFYKSNIYRAIKNYKNYKNEFQVYLKENDYYLYGIIDKIIFENKRIILIDYKTDNIRKDQINYRIENYLPQLQFYSYIIKQLYPSFKKIEIRLIFIKHPDDTYSELIDSEMINNYGKFLEEAIFNMRKNTYTKNLSHCSQCLFTDLSGNCIKQ